MERAQRNYPRSQLPELPVVAEFSDSDLDSEGNVSSNAVLKSPSNLRIKVRKACVLVKRVMPFFSHIVKFAAGIGLRPYLIQPLLMRTCNAIPDGANDFSFQCDDQNESHAYVLMTYGLSVAGVYSACNLLKLLAARAMRNVKGAARKLTVKKRRASDQHGALHFSTIHSFKTEQSRYSTKVWMGRSSQLPRGTKTSADKRNKSLEDVIKERFASMTREELEAEAKLLYDWCIKFEKCKDPEKVKQLNVEEMYNDFRQFEERNGCFD